MPGCRIGPPAERLYAVDPVAVEMIRPSPRYVVRNEPPAQVGSVIIFPRGPLLITASLSA